jgi:hypothetical protein
MISLRYYKKYKNRLRFDIVIKDWKNYNGRMLWYSIKTVEIEIFKHFKIAWCREKLIFQNFGVQIKKDYGLV